VLNLQPRSRAIVQAYYGRRGLGINTAAAWPYRPTSFIQELAEDLKLDQEQFAAQSEAETERNDGRYATASRLPPQARLPARPRRPRR